MRIGYETERNECRAIPVNIELPFDQCSTELDEVELNQEDTSTIREIAGEESVYGRVARLADFLSISTDPARDILYILSLAYSGDTAGLRLLFPVFASQQSPTSIISGYSEFSNIRRVMRDIEISSARGGGISEREKLFVKKIEILPISHPLPGNSGKDDGLEGWTAGARRALADPEEKWNDSLRKRVLAELEAKTIRIERIFSRLDPERNSALIVELANLSEDLRWTARLLKNTESFATGSTLLLKKNLGGHWDNLVETLGRSRSGTLVNEMFEAQQSRVHSYPLLRAGTAVLRAVLTHPQISRTRKDLLSCLHIFIRSSADNMLKFVLSTSRIDSSLFGLNGFSVDDNILNVRLDRISRGAFLDDEGIPVDFDWSETIEKGSEGDYKFLILSNLDNPSFLKHILDNPKISSKPGVVSLISLKCKSAEVLTKIASRRELYTGFANKEVPRNLLANPARVPLSALRKFIHVRYIDKMSLRQMASKRGKGGQIREEIRREIDKYLDAH